MVHAFVKYLHKQNLKSHLPTKIDLTKIWSSFCFFFFSFDFEICKRTVNGDFGWYVCVYEEQI